MCRKLGASVYENWALWHPGKKGEVGAAGLRQLVKLVQDDAMLPDFSIEMKKTAKKTSTAVDNGVRRMDVSRFTGSDADSLFAALVGEEFGGGIINKVFPPALPSAALSLTAVCFCFELVLNCLS